MSKQILEIGNWPPPVCSWSMSLVGLRKELSARGWDCQVMNLNENRRVRNPEYIDVQSGWDYLRKVARLVWQGYAVHVRVNGETKKGYFLALTALLIARLGQRPAFLTYGGGHQQSYFPAPKGSLWHLAFSLLFRIPHRIYCNSPAVKNALLTTGISEDSVEPIPHFSSGYVEFDAAPLPSAVEDFYRGHEAIFFNYVCFRKEFALDFLAEAVRSFRAAYPRIGFLLVGPWDREMDAMKTFLREQKLEDAVCVLGSVPHNVFLTLLSRSLAYIRTPVTDGICSSVLESLKLKVPVLAVDNGTRPAGTRLWLEGNLESLLALMTEAVKNHAAMVAEIPEIILEDNIKKLADSIERVGLRHKRMNGNYGWQAESGDMGYARLSPVIGDMAIDKGRFGFGRNWQRFLRVLDEERIREAEKSLCEMLRVSNLSGRSFLDVGCGSGIFSLAAMRLGASRVHSFDYDPESVACAHELKSRFFRSVARWTIERGDALDKNYVASLGTYDVVYSWGVLHHTGNLWQAMDNVLPRVADAGKLFLAIYNDAGKKSRRWCRLKKLYNSGALFRVTLLSVFIPLNVARRVVVDLSNLKNPVLRYRTYKKQRGMSMLRDWIDWIGGWPYEFATAEQVVEFCTSRGFGLLMHGNKSGWVLGNNEFVFERQRGVGVPAQ